MKGKRKFILTLIALSIFLFISLMHDNVNYRDLGFGLGGILFGFGIPNMMEHYNK